MHIPTPTNCKLEKADTSHIQEFFNDKTVFITGGTGYVGSVLIEKLLRCCPGIKKIYLLARSKKGRAESERLETIFTLPLFDRMKKEVSDYRSKLKIISGDCMQLECGISKRDQELIKTDVQIIFHVAATVRFDEKLRSAILINVKATRDLLRLARQMKNLEAFIYVSTAYSQCLREAIHEHFYDPPISADEAISEAENLDDESLEKLLRGSKGAWPNAYVYTKCIAEDVVRKMGKDLPVAIFRPSIVVGTAKDPFPGWVNSLAGPNGLIVSIYKGCNNVLPVDGDCIADLVPADYVINAMIVAAWNTATATLFLSMQVKIHKLAIMVSFFGTRQWKYNDENVMKLWNKLSDADKRIFDFNLKHLDWREVCYHNIRGICQYAFHDSIDVITETLKRRIWFSVIGIIFMAAFFLLCIYLQCAKFARSL